MPAPETFVAFATASIALLVVPGPSVLYVVTRSVHQGRAAGLVSVLGIHTGSIVHVAAAALGVSAILASSVVAFSVVKYAGAAYLIWLGVRALRRPEERVADGAVPRRSLRRIFAHGVVVNVLNPKTALFFLAFLPQFVDVSRGSVTAQVALLGLTFITLGFVSDGTYALLAARISRSVRGRARWDRLHRWVPGLTYLALGVASALGSSRRSVSA
ncbi:MAG TPA: LysE family translocator [Actinomycetota bacterium]|nr:LysE family translocator [Actinomycetota bacterium]